MSSGKVYYWLKLNNDFFEDDTVTWIEEQENGKDYIIFYLKLALKSLQDEGYLIRYVGEKLIPYDVKALAKLTNTSPDTVAVAMKLFIEIGLISRLDSGEIYLNQIDEMIGSETDSAKRVRKYRAKEKLLQSNGKMLQSNTDVIKSNTELELELELENRVKEKKTPVELKFNEDTIEYQLAYMLYEKILLNDDRFKKPNFENWSQHIDYLIRLDKRTVDEIKLVINYVTTDSFEMNNVLSTSKLRKRFTQLFGKAKQGGQAYGTSYTRDNRKDNEDKIDWAERAGIISL